MGTVYAVEQVSRGSAMCCHTTAENLWHFDASHKHKVTFIHEVTLDANVLKHVPRVAQGSTGLCRGDAGLCVIIKSAGDER